MKILTIILLFTFSVSAQETEGKIPFSLSLFNKCFEDLTPLKFLSENPSWNDLNACNLTTCSALLTIKDPEAIIEIKNRIIEITRKLFVEGTPIKLISGMDSGYDAEKLNENLKDDNGIVYISIASCISTKEDRMTMEIINAETERLLKLR